MLELCLLLLLSLKSTAEEIDYSEAKYIEDVVAKSIQKAREYKQPTDAYQYKAKNQTVADYGTFDYIVVGAGSSGAVIASRLSENENIKILLLEAGGPANTFTNIPAMMAYQPLTEFNWNFKTVPQTTCCLGMANQQCAHPRGRGLGGTSLINALMYVRGNKDDYNDWAKFGNKGWSYDEVLPYFIKSENSQIHGDHGYHGKGGLLNVEYHKPDNPILEAFLAANAELGRNILDINGKQQLGVAQTPFNTINGRRHSTGKAFLSMADRRTNLKILTYSYAKKVVINGTKYATGVDFDHAGQAYSASATKEVIISAGAFGSPQLLLLSGIGPSKILEPLGIPVISDISVGHNLQDHPTFYGLFFTTTALEPLKTLFEYSKEYLIGEGAFAIGCNAQGLTFIRTKSASTAPGVPNIEAILITQNATSEGLQILFGFSDDTYNTFVAQMDPQATLNVFLMLLHPNSRGSVRLNSPDPYEYPIIDANYLSDEQNLDIEEMYEGVQAVIELTNTTAFKKLDVQLNYFVLPACANYTYMSKEQWFCQIRHLTANIFHPVGTCKMGPDPKEGGVVNNELKVYGVNNLRVADTSIFPHSTSGHPNAPAIMVGEKIADEIKKTLEH